MTHKIALTALALTLMATPFTAQAASCPKGQSVKDGRCVRVEAPGKSRDDGARHDQKDHGKQQGKQAGNNRADPVRGYEKDKSKDHKSAREDNRLKHVIRRGDRIPDDARPVFNPERRGLPKGTYFSVDDTVFRVDPQTRDVIAIVGALSRLVD